jgi:hypothetical protein
MQSDYIVTDRAGILLILPASEEILANDSFLYSGTFFQCVAYRARYALETWRMTFLF